MQAELFFEVLHNKTHIFCQIKESDTINELKKIIKGILQIKPEDQILKKLVDVNKNEWADLSDSKLSMSELGFTPKNCKSDEPAVLAIVLPEDGGLVNITPVSTPPPLPEAMRHNHDTES